MHQPPNGSITHVYAYPISLLQELPEHLDHRAPILNRTLRKRQKLFCRLSDIEVAVQRCPRDMQEFANLANGVCLVSVELLGHGDF